MENEFYLGVFTQVHSETKQERLMCSLDINDNIITMIISILENNTNTFTLDYVTILNIAEILNVSTMRAMGLLGTAIHKFKDANNRDFHLGYNLPNDVMKELQTIVKNSIASK